MALKKKAKKTAVGTVGPGGLPTQTTVTQSLAGPSTKPGKRLAKGKKIGKRIAKGLKKVGKKLAKKVRRRGAMK